MDPFRYFKLTNAGAVTAAALKAEDRFDFIRVYERRGCAGGTCESGFTIQSQDMYHDRHYQDQSVLVVGNSASGHDVMTQLVKSKVCKPPIYVSRRSRSRWDGDQPPEGVEWNPVIDKFDRENGNIHFVDGTVLSNIDKVIYCTGYRPSFPFWNEKQNGRPFYNYKEDRVIENFQHTFLTDFPNVAIIGMPRVLTFRSFEYQAIAVARLWANRASKQLPDQIEQRAWLKQRAQLTHATHRRFHQIEWDCGEAMEWFRYLFDLAGLPALEGIGRYPCLGRRLDGPSIT